MLGLCRRSNRRIRSEAWLTAAEILLAALCSTTFAISLNVYEGNTYYGRSDKFDTTSLRDNFYEDIGLAVRNPGAAALSFSADMSVTNDKTSGMPKQYELRSTSLDWNHEQVGLNLSLGRQFINTFALDAGYLDGLSVGYDAGKVLSLYAFGGTASPSRYSDGIISLDPRRIQAGFYGTARIVRGTELGLGASADKQGDNDRHYRAAASLRSDIGHVVDIKGHGRFDVTSKTLDEYYIEAGLVRWDRLRLAVHAAGRAAQIDSVNYYERLALNRYNEGGALVGLSWARDISFLGAYSLRAFGDSLDHLASCNFLFRGISLRLNMNTGVHGTTYEIVPSYVFTYAQAWDVGAAFQFDRYKTVLVSDWRNAYTALVFGRWFVPWLVPAISLVIEPQVEYLVNDYYKSDLRVMFQTRFNFHGFWQSGQHAPDTAK
jgi:hypothetical protein